MTRNLPWRTMTWLRVKRSLLALALKVSFLVAAALALGRPLAPTARMPPAIIAAASTRMGRALRIMGMAPLLGVPVRVG